MLSKRRVESVRPDDPILEIPWEKLSEIGSESSLGLSLKNSLNRFLKTFGETSLLDDLYQSVLHGLDNLDGSGAFLGFLTHPDVSYRGKSPQSIQNKLARSELPTAFRRWASVEHLTIIPSCFNEQSASLENIVMFPCPPQA